MNQITIRTLLLVEDETLIAMTTKANLIRFGYRVKIAGSGEKAVDIISSDQEIELVLMDIDLGKGMDGTRAAQIILSLRDLPLIFLSSRIEPEMIARTELITSYGYVMKNSPAIILDASVKMAFRLFESKQREQKQQQRLDLAIKIANDGIWDWNINTNKMYFDDRFYSMAGYQKNEFPPCYEEWLKRIHPDDIEIFQDSLNDHHSGQDNAFDIQVRWLKKDRRWIWIRILGKIVARDEDGKAIRLIGTQSDISAQKLAEQNLQKQNLDLKFLNSLSLKLSDISLDDDIEKIIIESIRQHTNAKLTVFSLFDPGNNSLSVKKIDSDPGLLSLIIKIAGSKIINTSKVLSPEIHDMIVQEIVGIKQSLTEISFGEISPAIDAVIRKATGLNQFCAVAHSSAGKLYGTTLLGFSAVQEIPSVELLKSYGQISAIALKHRQLI